MIASDEKPRNDLTLTDSYIRINSLSADHSSSLNQLLYIM